MFRIHNLIILSLLTSCSFTGPVVSLNERGPSSRKDCIALIKEFAISTRSASQKVFHQKMAKYGYSITDNKLFKGSQFVGHIEVITPKYLYEWQDKEFHDAWIHNGGIIKEEMDEILNSPGQSYGRGYYISTDPFDSLSYGTHLTIFEVDKPLRVLTDALYAEENPIVLNELRDIGFAGLKATSTWFSIINEDFLLKAQRVTDENMKYIRSTFMNDNVVFKEFILSTQKALTKPEKPAEGYVKDLEWFVGHNDFFSLISLDPVINKEIFNKLTFSQLERVMKNKKFQMGGLSYLIAELEKRPYAKAFFSLYDLHDIASLEKGSKSLTWDKMMENAKLFDEGTKDFNLDNVESAAAFQRKLKDLFKIDFKIRSFESIVNSSTGEPRTLTVSKKSFEYMQRNRFLHISDVKKLSHNKIQVVVSYMNLQNISRFKDLLTEQEYEKILSEKNGKKALELTLNTLFNKFFVRGSIKNILPSNNFPNPSLEFYRAFVALRPFESHNEMASKLYYGWLNKEAHAHPHNMLNDISVMLPQKEYRDSHLSDWYATRLWVISAGSMEEMIKRAKLVLEKDPAHKEIMDELYYLKDEL